MIPRRKAWLLVAVLGMVAMSFAALNRKAVWYALCFRPMLAKPANDRVPLIRFLEKRAEWMPGERRVYPDQVCLSCAGSDGHHPSCLEGVSFRVKVNATPTSIMFVKGRMPDRDREGVVYVSLDSFRCTCPHPSH